VWNIRHERANDRTSISSRVADNFITLSNDIAIVATH
jgi:hypothetical protein